MHERARLGEGKSKAMSAAAAFLVLALAGCIGGSDDSAPIGIQADGGDGASGPYTFTANVESEDGTYTWDLGDRLTVLSGRTVQHTYDLRNADLTVSLRVLQNGTPQVHTMPLRLGTGTNAVPAFALDAQTDWAITGEPVTFSAGRSSDADSDGALRFSWACLLTVPSERLVRMDLHPHGVVGTPYQTPPAGSVTSYTANYTLPPPDQVFDGDLCEALAGGTPPSTTATTIQGTFTQRGKYSIFLLASDGAHSTVSGAYELHVTSPEERPDDWVRGSFNTTLQGGAGGAVQEQCATLPGEPQVCDQHSGTVRLDLNGLYGWLNVTHNVGPAGANAVSWELKRCEATVAVGTSPASQVLEARQLPGGACPYTFIATLQAGVAVDVEMSFDVRLNLDPNSVY